MQEPNKNAFNTIENEQLRTRLRLFIDNGTLINNIKEKLPTSTRQNPLTKSIISRNPGSVIPLFRDIIAEHEQLQERYNVTVSENILQATEKLTRLATVLLQGTQATIAAVETTNDSAKVLVNLAETAVVASQAPNEDEDLQLLSSTDILTTIQNTLTQARNNVTVSEAVIPQAEGCRKASERLLQILQDLTDSMMIDHRIVSGAETNITRTESIRLQKLFSLFPIPGLQWRFIKIDGTNINSFARQGNTAEIDYESTLTKFYEAFDFSKFPNLKIISIQSLSTLPDRINKIFINEVKTDGYTSHFTFARRRTENPMVKLELQNFKQDEIDLYFRPRTINPGRNHVFTSFHGDNEIRRMSTTDFYSYGEVKRRAGVSNIESNIPTTKTTSLVKYREHVRYIILYMADLFEFYGFNTSKMRWLNYMAEQKAQDAPVIILINGGKKYNKKRRKRPKTAKNKRQRRNNRNNRLANAPVLPSASAPVTTPFSRKLLRHGKFKKFDNGKMPLVIFGDGMFNKDGVHFKGHQNFYSL
ncbi:hypothetical protein HPULCUR_006987 [Helicostylum pulchrum]|uniref:Uncharacterized protein n=1 Tax=Helicostylum pulchrum TaxID=562976 RepID=A0ABP9Y3F2_9FUNG